VHAQDQENVAALKIISTVYFLANILTATQQSLNYYFYFICCSTGLNQFSCASDSDVPPVKAILLSIPLRCQLFNARLTA